MSFFQNHPMKAMVEYYNEIAVELGRPAVNRFSDRETAEKRCEAIRMDVRAYREAVAAAEAPQPKAQAQKEVTSMNNEAPAPIKEHDPTLGSFKTVRPSSNRAKLVRHFLAKQETGEFTSAAEMAEAVYGDATQVGPVKMVFVGLRKDLLVNKTGLEIETRKEGTKVFYRLKAAG